MNRQLFENTTRSDLKSDGLKKKLFILLSIIIHLAIITWLYIKPPILPAPASKPIKVSSYSSLVFLKPPPPPPPSPSLKRNIKKHDKPIEKIPETIPIPIEAPEEIKPEPPEEPEEVPTDPTASETQGKPEGKPDGVPGGVPGETGNNALSETTGSGQNIPVKPEGNVKPPTRTKYVAPVYPPLAIRARIEGTVIIEATIGKDGKIKNARVIRSVSILDQAALEAIKKWEYEPPTMNGKPIELILTVTVNFVLK